jgi:hypothetical protein
VEPEKMRPLRAIGLALLCLTLLALMVPSAFGHGVEEGDAQFLEGNEGLAIGPYIYLGAKHMVTGFDHILFLVGVIFFLHRAKDVAIYVSLFTIGHSATLLYGVFADIRADPFLIDAIIGFSVVYKGFDNLGGFRTFFGFQPDTRIAVFVFGLFHGFGLATKIQEMTISEEGLVGNIIAFNVGVELGQLFALGFILIGMTYWRTTKSFERHAFLTNSFLMLAGFLLIGHQLSGYFLGA